MKNLLRAIVLVAVVFASAPVALSSLSWKKVCDAAAPLEVTSFKADGKSLICGGDEPVLVGEGSTLTLEVLVWDPSAIDGVCVHIQAPNERDVEVVPLMKVEGGTPTKYVGSWIAEGWRAYYVDVVAENSSGVVAELEDILSYSVVSLSWVSILPASAKVVGVGSSATVAVELRNPIGVSEIRAVVHGPSGFVKEINMVYVVSRGVATGRYMGRWVPEEVGQYVVDVVLYDAYGNSVMEENALSVEAVENPPICAETFVVLGCIAIAIALIVAVVFLQRKAPYQKVRLAVGYL